METSSSPWRPELALRPGFGEGSPWKCTYHRYWRWTQFPPRGDQTRTYLPGRALRVIPSRVTGTANPLGHRPIYHRSTVGTAFVPHLTCGQSDTDRGAVERRERVETPQGWGPARVRRVSFNISSAEPGAQIVGVGDLILRTGSAADAVSPPCTQMGAVPDVLVEMPYHRCTSRTTCRPRCAEDQVELVRRRFRGTFEQFARLGRDRHLVNSSGAFVRSPPAAPRITSSDRSTS